VLDYSLEAQSALSGASFDYEGLSIRERPNTRLLSIAASVNQIDSVSAALNNSAGVTWAEIGKSTTHGNVACLGLQAEQVFLMSEHNDNDHQALAKELAAVARVTDQSDSWVTIEVSGSRSRDVLERICPIDLEDSVFQDGAVARTLMEHLGVIVYRYQDTYRLLSARSSADSFLHAITQSADFVV